jgi:hypothetical protein
MGFFKPDDMDYLCLELKVAHAMVILSALYPALSLGLSMVNQLRFWIEF